LGWTAVSGDLIAQWVTDDWERITNPRVGAFGLVLLVTVTDRHGRRALARMFHAWEVAGSAYI
jgi:hypothetical protein